MLHAGAYGAYDLVLQSPGAAELLIGEQQVVVKPLPAFLSEFNLKDHGITGCTIMGDGNISIILDILSLYSIAVENA